MYKLREPLVEIASLRLEQFRYGTVELIGLTTEISSFFGNQWFRNGPAIASQRHLHAAWLLGRLLFHAPSMHE
jgi:hypothetical protein